MTEAFAVVGGEGFLGSRTVLSLKTKFPSASVASLDLVQRNTPSGYSFFTCDLSSIDSLKDALRKTGAQTVFHMATPALIGGANKEIMDKINVEGTRNLVQACKDCKVRKLIYTSSASVVYDGRDMINVDERLPPPSKPIDYYTQTKAIAEAIVLEANGQDGLLTCAIRPSGIFGPTDRTTVPGFITVYKTGKHKIQLGHGLNLCDWTYVDNVVHAHLLAAEKIDQTFIIADVDELLPVLAPEVTRRELPTSIHRNKDATWSDSTNVLVSSNEPLTAEQIEEYDQPLILGRNRYDQFSPVQTSQQSDYPIGGQAFIITNGQPMDLWDLARAIWFEYAGYDGKPRHLSPLFASTYGWVQEMLGWVTGKEPIVTRARVQMSTTYRYYNIEKARRVLGYHPTVGLEEGIKRTVQWYKEMESQKRQ